MQSLAQNQNQLLGNNNQNLDMENLNTMMKNFNLGEYSNMQKIKTIKQNDFKR